MVKREADLQYIGRIKLRRQPLQNPESAAKVAKKQRTDETFASFLYFRVVIMAVLLDIQHLTKRYGALELLTDVSFSVDEGQKVGLIARNGTGKSTFLSILDGDEDYEEGSIVFRRDARVSYLPQEQHFPADLTVLGACVHGKNAVELPAEQMLTKFGLGDRLDAPISLLSGGERKRVALARALLSDADLYVLDEPTNHLDLAMIEWLEEYLRRSSKAILLVTHDRYFLDRICSRIVELDGGTFYTYKGNYRYYLEKREERLEVERANAARARNLYSRELEWMRRMPQARGTKARYRKEAFVELQQRARQRSEERQARLEVKSGYIGSKIFEAQYVSKRFGDKILLQDFYYNFSRYEKMGIVGPNGAGKSTFVKMLLGRVQPDAGRFDIGETVRFGYFAQEQMAFDDRDKVIDAVRKVAETIDLGGGRRLTAMQFLDHFLFPPRRQQDYIAKLSGGERRRLQLCITLMQNPNFLILDEPTNDLDIATLTVLEEYLQDFCGCVIVVSHDRYFMDKVVDHLLVFEGGGRIKDFPGNYSQYRAWLALQEEEPAAPHRPKERTRYGGERARRMTFAEKREFAALGDEIEALEAQIKNIEEELCSGTLSVETLTAHSRLLPQLKDALDEKSMRWLELSEIES